MPRAKGHRRQRLHEFTDREQMGLVHFFLSAMELGLPFGIERMHTNRKGTVLQLSSNDETGRFATITTEEGDDGLYISLTYTERHGKDTCEWHFALAPHESDDLVPIPEPFAVTGKAGKYLALPREARSGIGKMYLNLEPSKWQEAQAIIERSRGWQELSTKSEEKVHV